MPIAKAPSTVLLVALLALAGLLLGGPASASSHAPAASCDWVDSDPDTPEERAEDAVRAAANELRDRFHARLPAEPDVRLVMPVDGVRVAQVADTMGAARPGGRRHEGQDIFAPRGTPVYSATVGYVYWIDTRERGGKVVWVAGAGGRRYYYAHLDDWGAIEPGMRVTPTTVLGYVGSTGNARTTPPHLHFGVYSGSRRSCDRTVHDPLPLLVDR